MRQLISFFVAVLLLSYSMSYSQATSYDRERLKIDHVEYKQSFTESGPTLNNNPLNPIYPVTTSTNNEKAPFLVGTQDGNYLYAIYESTPSGSTVSKIEIKISTDHGSNWLPFSSFTASIPLQVPAAYIANNRIHVVCAAKYTTDSDIYYFSYNVGYPATGYTQSLINTTGNYLDNTIRPAVLLNSSNKIYVGYLDESNHNFRVDVSTNNGTTWTNEKSMAYSSPAGLQRVDAAYGTSAYFTYLNRVNNVDQVTVFKNTTGTTWSTTFTTSSAGNKSGPSIGTYGNTYIVAYQNGTSAYYNLDGGSDNLLASGTSVIGPTIDIGNTQGNIVAVYSKLGVVYRRLATVSVPTFDTEQALYTSGPTPSTDDFLGLTPAPSVSSGVLFANPYNGSTSNYDIYFVPLSSGTQYTLNLTKGGTGNGQVKVNGTVRPLPYSESFPANASVTLEAVPGAPTFTGWSGDLTGTANPTTITMNSNKNITANFTTISGVQVSLLPFLNVRPGDNLEIPITVGNVSGLGILAYDFTIAYNSPNNILTVPTNPYITDGTLSQGWSIVVNTSTPNQIRVGGYGTSPLNGSGTLLKLKFSVKSTATGGQYSDLHWSNFIFNAGSPQAITTDGKITITPLVCGDADENGVVQMYDAARTAQHVVGIPPPLTTQGALNADVDMNGTVQVFDAALIAGKAIGNFPPFPVPTCFGSTELFSTNTVLSPVNIALPNRQGRTGDTISVPVLISDVSDTMIIAYDFTLKYNTSIVQFVDFKKEGTLSESWAVLTNSASDSVRVGGYNVSRLVGSGTMLLLRFKVIGTLGMSSVLNFTNFLFNNGAPLAITTNGQITVGTTSVLATNGLPTAYTMVQNYPNPFNPKTTIEFAIPKPSGVSLKIFDIMGQEVATLVNEQLNPGTFKAEWDASGFASGIYFYRLQAGDFVSTKKLILLR